MSENTQAGREPIQVVQIDQDFCTRSYGQLPCQAAFNENLLKYPEDMSQEPYWLISPQPLYYPDYAPLFLPNFEENGTTYNSVQFRKSPIDEFEYGQFSHLTDDGSTIGQVVEGQYYGGSLRIKIGPQYTAEAVDLIFEVVTNTGAPEGETSGVSHVDIRLSLKDGAVLRDISYGTEPENDFGFSVEVSEAGDYMDVHMYANAHFTGAEVTNNVFQYRVRFNAFEGTNPYMAWGAQRVYTGKTPVPYVKTDGEQRRATGTDKCFNTRSTCQDPANYDKGVLPLNFVTKGSPTLTDGYYLPMLQRPPKVTPARLNPGGANSNARALGTRAQLSVSFKDAPHNDRDVDPYRDERNYDPLERGTFWTKWRARNPYYMQRPIRLLSGYLQNGQMVDTISRSFVITGFKGPDAAGNVTLEGKDILTLAEDEKAQAPVASKGKLAGDISAGATSASLTPSGIGNAEYPTSGYGRIGKEVVSFTRSGDSLTISRGQYGTEAKAHDADDTFQLCLRYVSQDPQDILNDLFANYAGIPTAYLDTAQWNAEALDFLPRKYSAIITEPTGVSQLVGEMCQQMYFTVWWDERTSKVVLKAVRLAQEDEVYELDDARHLIKDSVKWEDLADELITQVWVYYGQIDPTDKLDQGSNYSTIAITADPLAEGADKHNLRRVKTIFSRWIDATNASAAEDLGRRILNRYGNAPRQVTFKVDAKDDYLWLGAYTRLTNRLRVDAFGRPVPVNLQIFEAAESVPGSEYVFKAQEFIPALIGGESVEDPTDRTIPITSDLLNVDLRALHDSLFGAPTGTETVTFIVREGVTIGGDAMGGGVNVQLGQRVAVNDFYDAGGSAQFSGVNLGQVPAMQRQGIGAARTTPAGGTTSGTLGRQSQYTDAVYKEYPAATALRTGTWPSGVTLKLILEAGARILGEGGNGGVIPGDRSEITPTFAGDGGHALQVSYAVEITNGGTIAGGGGGGQSQDWRRDQSGGFQGQYYVVAPGGGGAGRKNATTATVIDVKSGGGATAAKIGRQAAAGSDLSPGQGALVSETLPGAGSFSATIDGKDGFNLGAGEYDPTVSTLGRDGFAGKAVAAGANLIEWVNRGDVRGTEVN